MIGATPTELAEHYRLSQSTVYNWIKEWDDSTDHPFPEAFAKIQFRSDNAWHWTRRVPVYRLHAVSEWRVALPAARKRKRAEAQRNERRRLERVVLQPIDTKPLEDALAQIVRLREELAGMQAKMRYRALEATNRPIEWTSNF